MVVHRCNKNTKTQTKSNIYLGVTRTKQNSWRPKEEKPKLITKQKTRRKEVKSAIVSTWFEASKNYLA